MTGKKAITPDGNTFGTIKDIAFSMDGSVGLVITKKDDSEVIIPIRQAGAIGEFVLLSNQPQGGAPPPSAPSARPAAPRPAELSTCPSCGSPLKAGAKFCGKCGYKVT